MEHYDIVVVGAGPAGLMAARTLATSSMNFLVIDPKKEIGLPLRCGEGIREDGFVELFGSTRYSFVKNRCSKFETCCRKTKRVLELPYLVLDRPEFEKWLANPIKDNFMLRTSCKDIIRKSEYLEIFTNKGRIKAKLAILANGCDYRIQKKFGMVKKTSLLIPCYGGRFRGQNFNPKQLHFFCNEEVGTIAWLFPKDKTIANAGMGRVRISKAKSLEKLFKKFIHEKNLCGKASFAGVFPSSGPISRTYTDRILACGNAAGQVYAGTGEGIYFSLKAGQIAGQTAVEAVKKKDFSRSFLKQYENQWKKSFGKQLDASIVFAELLLLGIKYKIFENILRYPSNEQLKGMFMHGKVPLKARLAYYIARLYKSNPSRKIPWGMKWSWKLYRGL